MEDFQMNKKIKALILCLFTAGCSQQNPSALEPVGYDDAPCNQPSLVSSNCTDKQPKKPSSIQLRSNENCLKNSKECEVADIGESLSILDGGDGNFFVEFRCWQDLLPLQNKKWIFSVDSNSYEKRVTFSGNRRTCGTYSMKKEDALELCQFVSKIKGNSVDCKRECSTEDDRFLVNYCTWPASRKDIRDSWEADVGNHAYLSSPVILTP